MFDFIIIIIKAVQVFRWVLMRHSNQIFAVEIFEMTKRKLFAVIICRFNLNHKNKD